MAKQSKRDELLEGLEYDNYTGNYRATEVAAADYDTGDKYTSEAWQDENGQWWVDGNAVAETLSQVEDDN